MPLSMRPDPLAWHTLNALPSTLSTHASPPPHDLSLLAPLDGHPAAAFLLNSPSPSSLHCLASSTLDSPHRPLLLCALIPFAHAHGATFVSLSFALRPPPHSSSLSPDAYAQQLPFDPSLFTPTLLALIDAGALPSTPWRRLPRGLILATVTLDTSP